MLGDVEFWFFEYGFLCHYPDAVITRRALQYPLVGYLIKVDPFHISVVGDGCGKWVFIDATSTYSKLIEREGAEKANEIIKQLNEKGISLGETKDFQIFTTDYDFMLDFKKFIDCLKDIL